MLPLSLCHSCLLSTAVIFSHLPLLSTAIVLASCLLQPSSSLHCCHSSASAIIASTPLPLVAHLSAALTKLSPIIGPYRHLSPTTVVPLIQRQSLCRASCPHLDLSQKLFPETTILRYRTSTVNESQYHTLNSMRDKEVTNTDYVYYAYYHPHVSL